LQAIKCDNGREFDNSVLHSFVQQHGITLRFSCPYTSQQNSKAERIICTLNNVTCTLLIQASMPPRYWVEALHTTILLHNRLPSKPSRNTFHIVFFMAPIHPMLILEFWDVSVTQTPPPLRCTSLLRALCPVCSLGIHPTIMAIDVSIVPLKRSSSLDTSFSMSPPSPLRL
jgi:hypothetical protein